MTHATPPPPAGQDVLVASRTIAAPPEAVFALLADPARHHETEPGDWVRDSVEAEPAPITEVGQTFAVKMFLPALGGDYTMVNRVTDFAAGRTIAWAPGMLSRSGRVHEGGHIWRYDLEPDGAGTRVTLTYDWREMSQGTRDWMPSGMPPFPPEFLDASLAALDRAVGGTAG
ncbi:MAG TPA: SRPBCC family protein [Dermatophilaceae bacterium]|nr:SRPBCC family protein [Dermatophilaceae bacterium]